jgi:thiamine-phosphate pyrophosphorylase
VLQLREKSLGDGELLDRARRLRELTREHDVLLIINDRADVARLAGADGVHLGRGDLPVSQGRQIVGPHLLIGTSTHSIEEARAALGQGPDYVAVGPMFPSATKPELAVRGPGLLGEVAELADVPVVAVGGITAENVSGLSVRGRLQVAVGQSVIGAADPAAAARELRDRLSRGPVTAG